ncbi:MAG: ABC transporter permease [Candidatus Hydrogenedentota bacterium]
MKAELLRTREAALVLAALVLGARAIASADLTGSSAAALAASYAAPVGMTALALTFIVSAGRLDVSVGAILTLCAAVLAGLSENAGWPFALAAAGALAVGGAAGMLNGALTAMLRIPSFWGTLATALLFSGIAMAIGTGGTRPALPDGFLWLGQGEWIPAGFGAFLTPSALLWVALTAGGGLVLRRTWMGRYAECIGENETAARFAAIPIRRLTVGFFTLSGLACGLAALFAVSAREVIPIHTFPGLELDAIACVLLGGTRLRGGRGSVWGTFLAVVTLGLARYNLEHAGFAPPQVLAVVGLLLVAAAIVNERFVERTPLDAP